MFARFIRIASHRHALLAPPLVAALLAAHPAQSQAQSQAPETAIKFQLD